MGRTMSYFYPNEENPHSLKVYQDLSVQFCAFYFHRDFLKQLTQQEFVSQLCPVFSLKR